MRCEASGDSAEGREETLVGHGFPDCVEVVADKMVKSKCQKKGTSEADALWLILKSKKHQFNKVM